MKEIIIFLMGSLIGSGGMFVYLELFIKRKDAKIAEYKEILTDLATKLSEYAQFLHGAQDTIINSWREANVVLENRNTELSNQIVELSPKIPDMKERIVDTEKDSTLIIEYKGSTITRGKYSDQEMSLVIESVKPIFDKTIDDLQIAINHFSLLAQKYVKVRIMGSEEVLNMLSQVDYNTQCILLFNKGADKKDINGFDQILYGQILSISKLQNQIRIELK